MIDSKSGINAFLGIYAELGIASAAGVGTVDSSSISGIELIDFSAQGASDYGYSSFESINYLPFEGSGSDGLDVFQIDAAKRPVLENIKTYAVTGTDTSSANELAVNGQGVLIEATGTDLVMSTTTGLPLNDFVWEIEFTMLDNPTEGRIVENSEIQGTDRNYIARADGGFVLNSWMGAINAFLISEPIADVSNRRWIVRYTKRSTGVFQELGVFEKDFIDHKEGLDSVRAGDVPAWNSAKNYGFKQGGLIKTDMILHRETMTNLDGSIVYSNYEPEGLAAGGYASIDSTVNNLTLTNQNPSGKTFDVYSLAASDLYINYGDNQGLFANGQIIAGDWYGFIWVAETTYSSSSVGTGVGVIGVDLVGSNDVVSESSGKLQFFATQTTTTVFDDTKHIIAGAVAGDGVNAFTQIFVDGTKEDEVGGPSSIAPLQIPAITPINAQLFDKYKYIGLTEPVSTAEQLTQIVQSVLAGV